MRKRPGRLDDPVGVLVEHLEKVAFTRQQLAQTAWRNGACKAPAATDGARHAAQRAASGLGAQIGTWVVWAFRIAPCEQAMPSTATGKQGHQKPGTSWILYF
jgi:hypothetical protein